MRSLIVLAVFAGVALLVAAAPALSRLVSSLTVLIVVVGVVICVVRVVWTRTRWW